MENYKKVVLTEKDDSKTSYQTDSKLKQFSNNYTASKLNKLYKEFDQISLEHDLENDQDLLNEVSTKVKTKSAPVSFSTKLYLTSAIIVVSLMLVLAIYNIFVINSYANSINSISQEVTVTEQQWTDAYNAYKEVYNTNKWTENSKETISNIQNSIDVTMLQSVEVETINGQTNWFDIICNFFSNLFGG